MLHLLLGTDWVTVRKEILSRIAQDVQNQQGRRILMVPELISHDTERRLCAAAGDTASRFAEVLSFPRLARRVAESMGKAVEPCMDAGGRVVAMAAAAQQLSSQLKAYAAVQTRPEFLSQLVEAVDEFKRCCITPQDLMDAAEKTQGAFSQRMEELSLLLGAYDGLCQRGKRDPRDQMNWLLEQLQDGEFGQNHVFYVDGFPDFTVQHREILEYLIRVSPNVTVGLNCDRMDSEKIAFEKAGETAKQLTLCARRAGVEVQIDTVPGEATMLSPVYRAMFQGTLPEVSGACLRVWKAESAFQEVRAAAERILELVRSGCRYRDISIVCGDMASYQSLISLEFRRCGIPVYQSGTEDILQKTVIGTVLSALNAALGGFDQRDMLQYLRSALSPLSQELCDRVENYAILWNIRGSRWQSPWENHPDGLGEEWTQAAAEELSQLEQARLLAVMPLSHLAQSFRQAKNVSEQVQGLYTFLEEIRLAQRLDDMAKEMDELGDNRSAQILNQLWEILLGALEQLHDVLGQTLWDGERFARLLTLLLSQYDVGTIPPVLDAVLAGPVSAMRCQEETHLFVLGADEGVLPGYCGSSGLLSDQDRIALRDLGVSLTGGAMEGLQAEFAEVYGVFCGARQSMTVSWSSEQPSYLARRLSQMAGGVEQVSPKLGGALTDPVQAGAYLARWGAKEAAKQLGLTQWYEDTLSRADYTMGSMTEESVRQLYGSTLHLSASQVDRQAECRMSYFLKYGIKAKERKQAEMDPAEFGAFVHAVLEQTAKKVMELGGFQKVSLEQTMELALTFSEEYTRERFRQIDSQQLSYLFSRNCRELEMVVAELWQELKESRFQPRGFEVAFGAQGEMPAIAIPAEKMNALLRGFVDRVDIWQENGQNYFRVVDYKTGKKSFDYCDVLNGVGLQMLLYLFALERGGEEMLGSHPVAAGVQYFPARAPLITADGRLTDEQAAAERSKQWKRKGLLLKDEQVLEAMDPENTGRLCCSRKADGTLIGDLADRAQMKLLKRYVFEILGGMVEEIASGNVTPNPYTRGTAHNACDYCPYGAVCHQSTVEGRRNYKAMSAQEFWNAIGKEEV